MIFSSIISRLIDVSFFLMIRGSNSDFLSRGTAVFACLPSSSASSPFSRTSPTISLNTDFRFRTSSAYVSTSNSRSFSLRSCFAARTSGLSLYLGIILTSDLIFLFYTVSEVYTISEEVSFLHLKMCIYPLFYFKIKKPSFAQFRVNLGFFGCFFTAPFCQDTNVLLHCTHSV